MLFSLFVWETLTCAMQVAMKLANGQFCHHSGPNPEYTEERSSNYLTHTKDQEIPDLFKNDGMGMLASNQKTATGLVS